VRLTSHTWTELPVDRPPVICLPVGSCEQHGPHLPLDTDTVIAELLAERLAEQIDGIVVGPSLTVTASGEHAGFPGTLSIGTAALTTALVELVRSADWAGGVVLVNGHGGNRRAVDDAVGMLHAEGRDVLAWWPSVAGGDAHAGETETSILLAAAPGCVRDHAGVAGARAPLAELAGRLRHDGVRAVSATGVLGDPTTASPELGRRLLDALVEDLAAAVRSWQAGRRRR
jgi:creatinine amidohydrolase